MAKKRRHLGEILYKRGLVDKETLTRAIRSSKANNKRLGETLLELGVLDEEQMTFSFEVKLKLNRPFDY